MERMGEDLNSNTQKMTIFGSIMQSFESNFESESENNSLGFEEFGGLLRIATSNKVCYFDHSMGYLRKTLEILAEERSPNLRCLNEIWATLDSLDSDSFSHTREDISLGKKIKIN